MSEGSYSNITALQFLGPHAGVPFLTLSILVPTPAMKTEGQVESGALSIASLFKNVRILGCVHFMTSTIVSIKQFPVLIPFPSHSIVKKYMSNFDFCSNYNLCI